MLKFFKVQSSKRTGWFMLFLSAVALETTALYFQHGMNLQPCVMCIYERVALFGILFAGLFGMLAPSNMLLRLLSLLLGLGSAITGLLLADKHVSYQLHPSPWNQCSSFADFPSALPLDKWLPAVFNPTGSCSEISWQFLGFSMVQWLEVIFAFYTVLLALLLLSQFKKLAPKQRSIFK